MRAISIFEGVGLDLFSPSFIEKIKASGEKNEHDRKGSAKVESVIDKNALST